MYISVQLSPLHLYSSVLMALSATNHTYLQTVRNMRAYKTFSKKHNLLCCNKITNVFSFLFLILVLKTTLGFLTVCMYVLQLFLCSKEQRKIVYELLGSVQNQSYYKLLLFFMFNIFVCFFYFFIPIGGALDFTCPLQWLPTVKRNLTTVCSHMKEQIITTTTTKDLILIIFIPRKHF